MQSEIKQLAWHSLVNEFMSKILDNSSSHTHRYLLPVTKDNKCWRQNEVFLFFASASGIWQIDIKLLCFCSCCVRLRLSKVFLWEIWGRKSLKVSLTFLHENSFGKNILPLLSQFGFAWWCVLSVWEEQRKTPLKLLGLKNIPPIVIFVWFCLMPWYGMTRTKKTSHFSTKTAWWKNTLPLLFSFRFALRDLIICEKYKVEDLSFLQENCFEGNISSHCCVRFVLL